MPYLVRVLSTSTPMMGSLIASKMPQNRRMREACIMLIFSTFVMK